MINSSNLNKEDMYSEISYRFGYSSKYYEYTPILDANLPAYETNEQYHKIITEQYNTKKAEMKQAHEIARKAPLLRRFVSFLQRSPRLSFIHEFFKRKIKSYNDLDKELLEYKATCEKLTALTNKIIDIRTGKYQNEEFPAEKALPYHGRIFRNYR